MEVIVPVVIKTANLISSNAPENDQPLWNGSTTYSAGAKVMVVTADDHHIYESLQAGNIGKSPKENPLWWLDLGANNRWMMFDNLVSSQTTVTGALTFVLQPGGINSLALINLDGNSVLVEMKSGAGITVYSKSFSLRTPSATSFYTYFFNEIGFRRTLVINDLPNFYEGTLHVSIEPGADGNARCGVCSVGKSYFLGNLQYDSGGGNTDYSTVSTDAFGITTFVPRTSAAKMNGSLFVDRYLVDSVVKIMSRLTAITCVWSGSKIYDSSVIYGYRKDFTFSHKSATHSIFNIEIQGIT